MKITNKKQWIRRAWMGLLVTCCLNAAVFAANNIVAVVGRQVVTQQELAQRMQSVRDQNRNGALPADLPRQVLESLIVERAQLQAAMDMGIQISDADLDQAQQRIAAQNGMSTTQLLQRVQQDGLSVAGYRQQLRDQLMVQRARERVLDQRLKITPADVQATLDAADQQSGEQALELAQVLIAVPEHASEAQRAALQAKAEQVAKRAQQGEDFAALVSTFSDAQGQLGGSLGLKPQAAYPALFVDATAALPVGGVSALVRSGAGFHVLKVLQRSAAPSSLAVVQTHARHILRRAENATQRQAAVRALERVRADIQSGRLGFAAAAAQWGEDSTATQGGDLGWAQPGQFVPAFEAAMNALRPGVLSAPVETEFGVHLIEVLERRQVPMNAAQQRAWAESRLRAEKGEQILAAWVREVRAGSYVRIEDPALQ